MSSADFLLMHPRREFSHSYVTTTVAPRPRMACGTGMEIVSPAAASSNSSLWKLRLCFRAPPPGACAGGEHIGAMSPFADAAVTRVVAAPRMASSPSSSEALSQMTASTDTLHRGTPKSPWSSDPALLCRAGPWAASLADSAGPRNRA